MYNVHYSTQCNISFYLHCTYLHILVSMSCTRSYIISFLISSIYSSKVAQQRKQLIANSKYLGGDMEHTHLVKGLDYALLQKVKHYIRIILVSSIYQSFKCHTYCDKFNSILLCHTNCYLIKFILYCALILVRFEVKLQHKNTTTRRRKK